MHAKSILLNGMIVIKAWDKSKEQEKKLATISRASGNNSMFISPNLPEFNAFPPHLDAF